MAKASTLGPTATTTKETTKTDKNMAMAFM